MSVVDTPQMAASKPAAVGWNLLDPPTCEACTNTLTPGKFLELECTCYYCSECLVKLFETAFKDETRYPPQCCGLPISTRRASKQLPKTLVKDFRSKQLELRTKDRTYCWRPKCSAFIAPHSIHNGQAICQKCRAVTCSKCKNPWHYGPCTEGEDASFYEFVRSRKMKKCPTCKRIVEKNGGCNHVVCRCGREMCYGCGKESYDCVCLTDDEEEDEDDNEVDSENDLRICREPSDD